MPWHWKQIRRYRRFPGPPAIPNQTAYGVNTFEPPYGSTAHATNIAACQAIGATVIRCGLTWSTMQTTSGGAIDWSEYDSIYTKCLAAGITPLFALLTTPQWANPSITGTYSPYAVPVPGPDVTPWVTLQAAWMGQVAARYPLALYEIWNEWSSSSGSWREGNVSSAKPTVATYGQLHIAGYAAIKAAAPSTLVGVGGMTAVTYYGDASATYAVNVVPLLLAIPGFVTDAWNIHPYTHDFPNPNPTLDHYPTSNSFPDIGRFQAVMIANGEGNKPLWVTEWGNYSAAAVGGEATKAAFVTQSLRMIRNQYGLGKVGAGNAGVTIACFYTLQNDNGGDNGLYAGPTPYNSHQGVTTQLASGAAYHAFTSTL